jgi:uncharacterized Zn finger protein
MDGSPDGKPADGAPPVRRPGAIAFGGLHAAELYCDNCQMSTRHRILTVARERRTSAGNLLEGTARCSQCRWTHPFQFALPEERIVPSVVSTGRHSSTGEIRVASSQRLLVGSRVPRHEPPLKIVRIDLRTGGRATDALARDIATLWLIPDGPRAVPVSLVLGPKTAVTRAELPPEQLVEVGRTISVAGGTLRVAGLRARNRTWTHPGDRFPAGEVTRIYTRRTEIPPAGSSRWSSSRETPRSRTISTSRSERSRSSPGVRTRRSRPRARSAWGGAAAQRVSPS